MVLLMTMMTVMMMMIRNILGTKNLHEILSERESISSGIQELLDEGTEPWGILVERVEM